MFNVLLPVSLFHIIADCLTRQIQGLASGNRAKNQKGRFDYLNLPFSSPKLPPLSVNRSDYVSGR